MHIDWCSTLHPHSFLTSHHTAAGLLANFLVENMNLGPVAPFDAAGVVLLLGGAIILASWGENKGSEKANTTIVGQFKDAFNAIIKGTCIRGAKSCFGAD